MKTVRVLCGSKGYIEDGVAALSEDGWFPVGGVDVMVTRNDEVVIYQAMEKSDEDTLFCPHCEAEWKLTIEELR